MKLTDAFLFFVLLPTFFMNAQVGIGTTNPNASLDIRSSNEATPTNTDGMLLPKIDEYPATNPTVSQDGMMVYATGDGSVTKGFYYWDNGAVSWVAFSGASGSSTEKIDDLLDGKSDNSGTRDGSSLFLGVDAGLNDDGSDNMNVGIGFESLKNNTTGGLNTANGYQSLTSNLTGSSNTANGIRSLQLNTTGSYNTANGYVALSSNLTGSGNTANGINSLQSNTTGSSNTANGSNSMLFHTTGSFNVANGAYSFSLNTIGSKNVSIGSFSLSKNLAGNNNTAIGNEAGYNTLGSNNVFIGYRAGYNETSSNRLYIENSNLVTPLIYGEFDNDLLRVNGDFEVEKTVDAGITVLTPFGYKSSLKLFESGGSGDYGFEFEYDGSPDKLYLWSRTFSGNEGIRMTWLKNGRVGISTTAPNALLDVSSTDPTAPKNTDGMLVPRLDAFPSTNPTSSQNGMLVFLTTENTFYFWKNSTSSWVSINTSGSQSINDLSDGKSDDDGSQDGSSVFLGINAGTADDSSDNRNVGVGFQTLQANSSGSANTALGYQSMLSNTTGYNNVANGSFALYSNTTGFDNVANGTGALSDNTTGYLNTANGYSALSANTIGANNIANGSYALSSNTTGNNNVANGSFALYYNTTGYDNVANGYQALYRNTTGARNTANGFFALTSNSTGTRNTANGSQALYLNTTGNDNVANGSDALYFNTTGYDNVANGYQALYHNTSGYRNVANGYGTLFNNTNGDYNTAIGYYASFSGNHINSTTIGYNTSAASNSVHIGNTSVLLIRGQVNFSTYSDVRVKDNIEENVKGLDFITKLRPVTYNFNIDRQNNIMGIEDKSDYDEKYDLEKIQMSGFIAQEVEAAAKKSNYNFSGVKIPKNSNDLYGLSYAEFVVPLVKAVQEQQTQIEALKKEIAEIKALLTNK